MHTTIGVGIERVFGVTVLGILNASFHTYLIPRASGTFLFVLLHIQVHYRARRPPPALLTNWCSTGPLSHSPAYLRPPCKHLLLLSPFPRAITDLFRTLFGDEPIAPQTPHTSPGCPTTVRFVVLHHSSLLLEGDIPYLCSFVILDFTSTTRLSCA